MPKKYVPAQRQKCPHCGKESVTKSHIRLCPQNPDRPKGGSPSPVEPPRIDVVPDVVAEADMPPFEAEPEPQPATSQPGATTQPATIECRPIVDVLCGAFDLTLTGETKPDGPPRPPQPVTDKEKDQLSDALGAALARYSGPASPFLEKWAPLINVVFVTAAVFGPRILQGRAYLAYRAAEARRAREAEVALRAPASTVPIVGAEPDFTSIGDALARRQLEPGP